MAKKSTKKKKRKNEFRVRLSECGQDNCNMSYGKFHGKYALDVCKRALITMIQDMVGKENTSRALFELSLYFLKNLHKKFDEKFPELKDDDFEEYLKIFAIKEDVKLPTIGGN